MSLYPLRDFEDFLQKYTGTRQNYQNDFAVCRALQPTATESRAGPGTSTAGGVQVSVALSITVAWPWAAKSFLCAPVLYSSVVLHAKQTGWRDNDFTARGCGRREAQVGVAGVLAPVEREGGARGGGGEAARRQRAGAAEAARAAVPIDGRAYLGVNGVRSACRGSGVHELEDRKALRVELDVSLYKRGTGGFKRTP